MERAEGDARGPSGPGSLLVGRGRRAPLISIHTYFDELDHDRAVAAALDDRPVFAILPPGPEEGPIPDRMEQWVDRSVRAIRSAGLEGPHHLIGWSLGGIIAWEVARRLRAEGETVAYAANIDAMRAKLRPRRVGDAVRYHLDELLRWGTFLPAGVDVHQVPGDHHSMWDAVHVDATAAAIARSLRTIDEQEVVPHGGDAQAG